MADPLTTIFTTALALSGWGKVAFDYLSGQPLVKGRILHVIQGRIPNPHMSGEWVATFSTFLYLTNARKGPVHIVDYQMDVFARGDWIRLLPVLGLTQDIHLSMTDGSTLVVDDLAKNLIAKKIEPIEFGKAAYGWILFGGPIWLDRAAITQYRLTCMDVFGKPHQIMGGPEQFLPPPLLRELAGFRVIPPGARPR